MSAFPSFSSCAEAALWTIWTLVSDPVLPNLDECHHYNPISARTGPHFLNHPDPLLFQTHQRARLPRKANFASLLVRAKYSGHVDVALTHSFSSTNLFFPSSFFNKILCCFSSMYTSSIHPLKYNNNNNKRTVKYNNNFLISRQAITQYTKNNLRLQEMICCIFRRSFEM